MRTIRHSRRTAGALTGVLLAATALALPPAYAAAPANDSIRNATRITAVPAKYVVKTQEATSSRSDGPCVGGSSIWYRYRPSTTRTLRAVTLGSNFHTLVAVFTGPRSDRDLVACNDDDQAHVQLRFTAGTTYWIAVSRCCNPTKTGRRAVLRLYEPVKLAVTTTNISARAGEVSGQLLVKGTTTCTNPSDAYVSVSASQRVGDGVAQGYYEFFSGSCEPGGLTWEFPLWSGTGWAFQAGKRVLISVDSYANDGFKSAHNTLSAIYPVTVAPDARRTP